MAKIIVKREWTDTQPGFVVNKDNPKTVLRFFPESLAPGIDIQTLKPEVEVDYDLGDGKQISNLRPLSLDAAPPPPKPAPTPAPTSPPQAHQADDAEPNQPVAHEQSKTNANSTQTATPQQKNPAISNVTGQQGRIATRACSQFHTGSPMLGTRQGTPAPYTFVHVRKNDQGVDAVLADLVTHDGRNAENLLTGEIDFEITALTPLLAGQHRYPWRKLRTASGDQLISAQFSEGKKILEPAIIEQRDTGPSVTAPGREIAADAWRRKHVVIPSTSIKGPIRQAIGTVLNAPMERVGERRMSYRPNVDITNVVNPRYKPFAALVIEAPTDKETKVRILREMNSVFFVESPNASGQSAESSEKLKPETRTAGARVRGSQLPGGIKQTELPRGTFVRGYRRDTNADGQPLKRLVCDPGEDWPANADYVVCHYHCGIDGDFRLAQLTKDLHARGESEGSSITAKHYFRALVASRRDAWFPESLTIGQDLLTQHRQLLQELADRKVGHISRLPKGLWGRNLSDSELEQKKEDAENAIKSNTLKQYQLIYVEAELNADGSPQRIVSFGTHFRYRWRFSNSVREIRIDPDTGKGEVRDILKPAKDEHIRADDGRAAGQLSGARLLFGYVADKSTATHKLAADEASFDRLAGRVTFNHAVEMVEPDRSRPDQRFLHFDERDGDARFLLPLRILGAPKPSAVEHYVQQDGVEGQPAATITYGDLPGDEGGELNGRKFYRHFPSAPHDGRLTGSEPFLAENADICNSDQATLARFVSRPGTRFRVRMRFRDLRSWELGALLVAANPNLLARLPEADRRAPLNSLIASARANAGAENEAPLFAQKLGYGRPLGFGSVLMEIEAMRLLGDSTHLAKQVDRTDAALGYVRAFLKQIQGRETALLQWLTVSRFAGQKHTDYPRASKGQERDKIYLFHSNIRIAHAKQRRGSNSGRVRWDERVRPSYEHSAG